MIPEAIPRRRSQCQGAKSALSVDGISLLGCAPSPAEWRVVIGGYTYNFAGVYASGLLPFYRPTYIILKK
jgi:hypothetical protein